MDVAAWLKGLALEQYADAFRANDIDDAALLATLSADDLRELGVTSVGHRKRLLVAIAALVDPASARSAPERTATPPIPPPVSDEAPAQAERRQLTVMFVDLVGSTLLSTEFDPEEMGEITRDYQKAVAGEIARFEGHIAKFMGDGALAYFGWPKTHEDEAERAIRAGLAVVRAVGHLRTPKGQPIAARIGIATGLVVVGELVGVGATREETVHGETPNLAARLEQLAPPGTVVVSEPTRRLVGTLFEFADQGRTEIKGFATPVRTFRVIGEGFVESRFEALHGEIAAPFVGRDQELALLLDRWTLAKSGEGQVVLLAGEPGIGKSRILLALRERLHPEEHLSVRYHGSPHHANSAWWPVIQQLERAAAFARDDTDAIKLGKLEALLARAVAEVTAIIPFFAELLSLPTEGGYALPPLTPQERKARTCRALLAQVEGLAAKKPVLIALEDAHWLDPTTLELFALVVQRIERLPVLLIVTFRPEFSPLWIGDPHVTALRLTRLGRVAAQTIIEQLAGGKRLPEGLIAKIVARTDGVPLFVEELTKMILESGMIRETADAYILDGPLPQLAIPATLQDSLMARLDRLAPVKEVAQVGAVIGREFSWEILIAVTDMPEERLGDAIDRLTETGLILKRGMPRETTYVFKHSLVQEAARESLLKSRRRQLHAKVAEVLETRFPAVAEAEPERLAHHLTEADLADLAVGWWLKAGEQALRRTAYREAAAHLKRGIDILMALPPTPERQRREAGMQNRLAVIHLAAWGPSAEAETALARARLLSTQIKAREETFVAVFGQWHLNQQRMNGPMVLRLRDELLDTLRPDTSDAHVLQAHHAAWTSHWMFGQLEASFRHAEVGIGLYRHEAHHALAARFTGHDAGVCCRYTLGMASQLLGYTERARDRTADSLALAASLAHPQTQILALSFASCIYIIRRDAAKVRELTGIGVAECREQGVPTFGAAFGLMAAWADAMLGSDGDVRPRIAHAVTVMEERRFLVRRSFHLGIQAAICLAAGSWSDGLAAVEAALTFVRTHGERWYEPELYRLKGELLLSASRSGRENAVAALQCGIDAGHANGARWFELRATTSLARLWAEAGERRRAHDRLTSVYGWFTEGLETPDLKDAKALLDQLS